MQTAVFDGSITEAGTQLKQLLAQYRTTLSQTKELQAISLARYIRQEGGYPDWILGDIDDEQLTGSAESEKLYGFVGNDTLEATDGDTLIAGNGADTLFGNGGDDILKGGSGDDVYYGGDGNDLIDDLKYNYVWFTTYALDNDTLNGGAGNDTLKGGGGDDLYIFNQGDGNDVISDYSFRGLAHSIDPVASGGANDTLRFGNGITRDNLRWSFDGANLVFTITDSPNDSLTIENYINNDYAIENIKVDGSLLTTEELLNPQFEQSLTIGEFGRVTNFNHNSQTIELNNNYVNPVVFALPLSRNGGDPALVVYSRL